MCSELGVLALAEVAALAELDTLVLARGPGWSVGCLGPQEARASATTGAASLKRNMQHPSVRVRSAAFRSSLAR
jgi:hypothetical protein